MNSTISFGATMKRIELNMWLDELMMLIESADWTDGLIGDKLDNLLIG